MTATPGHTVRLRFRAAINDLHAADAAAALLITLAVTSPLHSRRLVRVTITNPLAERERLPFLFSLNTRLLDICRPCFDTKPDHLAGAYRDRHLSRQLILLYSFNQPCIKIAFLLSQTSRCAQTHLRVNGRGLGRC